MKAVDQSLENLKLANILPILWNFNVVTLDLSSIFCFDLFSAVYLRASTASAQGVEDDMDLLMTHGTSLELVNIIMIICNNY